MRAKVLHTKAGNSCLGSHRVGQDWAPPSTAAQSLGRKEPPGRGSSSGHMKSKEPTYDYKRRDRDSSRPSGLQCWACRAITAEAMAKAHRQQLKSGGQLIKPR
jgi:hypothetical protein